MTYLPFIVPLLGMGFLFFKGRGGFKAAAGWLLLKAPRLTEVTNRETAARALMLILAADLLGAVLTFENRAEDTAARGYLVRGEYGTADDTAQLRLLLDGEENEIELPVASRRLSSGEIRKALREAADSLPGILLQGTDPEHVDHDLIFPEKTGDPPVMVSWFNDAPEILDWDGYITDNVPEEGAAVTLTAELTLEEETVEKEIVIRVFPKVLTEKEALEKEVLKDVQSQNDETEAMINLPREIMDQQAVWSGNPDGRGVLLLMLGLLMAVLLIYAGIKRKETEEKNREEGMVIDYPHIVNKLVLLVSAGLSVRKAFMRIRDDYRTEKRRGGRMRPGYEVIAEAADEMEHGISEKEAYERIGRKSGCTEMKTLAVMLSQNLMKGGGELTGILRREAANASEERRKRARIRGEEAGTRLIMPMMLELMLVMAILMVPAFISFF